MSNGSVVKGANDEITHIRTPTCYENTLAHSNRIRLHKPKTLFSMLAHFFFFFYSRVYVHLCVQCMCYVNYLISDRHADDPSNK